MDINKDIQEKKNYVTHLKKSRDTFDVNIWSNIDSFFYPYGRGMNKNSETQGTRKGIKTMYSSEPLHALNIWKKGMFGNVFNPSTVWNRPILPISYKFLEAVPEVRGYLQHKQEVLMYALQQSNFYSQIMQSLQTGGSYGTVSMNVDEDKFEQKICCHSLHVREVYIGENKYGRVDTLVREFKMTARNMRDFFGEQNLSEKGKECFKEGGNHFQEFEIVHMVYPNNEFNPRMIGNKFKKFASKWYEARATDKYLRQSGMDSFRYPTWRYAKNDNSPYGVSPAFYAMCEIMGIQTINKDLYGISNRAARPDYNIPSSLKGKIDLGRGGNGFNVYRRADEKISVIQDGINYPIPFEFAEKITGIIEKHYDVPFFLAMQRLERSNMTTMEISARIGEQASLAAANTGDLTIFSDDILDIFDEIETAAGRMPQIPDIMLDYMNGNVKLNYYYQGPLFQKQRDMFELQSIERSFSPESPIWNLIKIWPDALDVLKKDSTVRGIFASYGYPQDKFEDDMVIDEIRQGRAAQEQETLRKVDMEKMSDILKNLGMAGKQAQGKLDSIIYGLLQGGAAVPPQIAA